MNSDDGGHRAEVRTAADPGPAAVDDPRTSRTVIEITDPCGLHMRTAQRFAGVAGRFRADVRVHRAGQWADGKSVLDLMVLAAGCGSRLEVEARGPDAEAATTSLADVEGVTRVADGARPAGR